MEKKKNLIEDVQVALKEVGRVLKVVPVVLAMTAVACSAGGAGGTTTMIMNTTMAGTVATTQALASNADSQVATKSIKKRRIVRGNARVSTHVQGLLRLPV
jgi:hypothetical protein